MTEAFHAGDYWRRLLQRIANTPDCLAAYVLGANDKWTMECVIADIKRTIPTINPGDVLRMSNIWRMEGPVIFTITRPQN